MGQGEPLVTGKPCGRPHFSKPSEPLPSGNTFFGFAPQGTALPLRNSSAPCGT